jgi:exodeoxyribonuclease VIII
MDYHADKSHMAKSALDMLHISPAHYQAWLRGELEKDTAALRFGIAAHEYILEFLEPAVEPDINKRTNAGKEEYAQWLLENDGKTIVTADDYKALRAMRESVLAHPVARKILATGEAEKAIYDEVDGIPAKCKPDWHNPKARMFADLKTALDASPRGFAKACANRRYHVQHAWYLTVARNAGYDVDAFVFIAIEKKPPYACGVYQLGKASVMQGEREFFQDLDTYRRCMETGKWPAYSYAIEQIELPHWALNDYDTTN